MDGIYFGMDVPIGPEWRHIELLRLSVLNCLTTLFKNQSFCESVSIVTSELLENAVKYGDWTAPDRSAFKLRVFADEETVQIEVSNSVAPECAHARALLDTVRWIEGFKSPSEAYEALMKKMATEVSSAPASRLGLARIVYESNCKLSATLDEDNIVHLSAKIPCL